MASTPIANEAYENVDFIVCGIGKGEVRYLVLSPSIRRIRSISVC
jgi:hypothetical protein